MRIVHCLKGNAGVIAVKVAILDQVLDGIDNLGNHQSMLVIVQRSTCLLQQIGLLQPRFKHCEGCILGKVKRS